MTFTRKLPVVPVICSRGWRCHAAVLLLTACSLAGPLSAQTAPSPGEQKSDANTQDRPQGRRGNNNPGDIQARMMANLRERFEVTDDAEWKLIADRITQVNELRRSVASDGFGGAGFRRGGNQGNRQGAAIDPAQDALRAAVKDKLPDAEIKARLARLRDERKQTEAKLDQAREDLRAILSVRQEAVAVLAGLLP